MSSGVHLKNSLRVELQLIENAREIEITDLPSNIKIGNLRKKIFEEIDLVDESCYMITFSQTCKTLTNRNIQQIFKEQEGYVILKKGSVVEECISVNADKPTSPPSSEELESQDTPKSSSSSTTKEETPKTPVTPKRPIELSNKEKRVIGLISACFLLVLAYSVRRYFYGNAKPKITPQNSLKPIS